MLLVDRLPVFKNWHLHVLAFGVLLSIQAILALVLRESILIVGDEASYLVQARYLSGTAHLPAQDHLLYHHPGYSLLIAPAFWLFDSPYAAYRACLIINALLMSTLYFSLHYVLTTPLGISHRLAILIAFITCLYPPLLLRASFAWNENAYVPAFMLLIALFATLLRYKNVRCALAFGLLLGFLYAIHPRSLALLPLAGLYLVLQGSYRALPWRTVNAALAAMCAVLISTRFLISHLKSAGGSQVSEHPILFTIYHLFSLQGIYDVVVNVNQQVLYMALSTFGLFPIGILAICYFLWQRRTHGFNGFISDVPTATLMFFLLAWLASMTLSASFTPAMPIEGGQLLKGRYVDGNSALIIALGLTAILCGRAKVTDRHMPTIFRSNWALRPIALVIVLLTISTALVVYGISAFRPAVTPSNALGIYPYFHLIESYTAAVVLASAVAAMGFILISRARGKVRPAAALVVACLFILFCAYNYRFAVLPIQERVARSTTLASYIRTHLGSPPFIAYDRSHYYFLTYNAFGYLLPHTRLLSFRSALGEKPQVPIVISSSTWRDAESLGAQFWQAEPRVLLVGADQALWTLPGPQQTTPVQQVDYSNTVLGPAHLPAWNIEGAGGKPAQSIWGIWQEGFFHPADSSDNFPLVWFNTAATLRVQNGAKRPRALLLNLISSVQRDTALSVKADGQNVFADSIPPGNWCEFFPLSSPADASHTEIELSVPPSDAASNALPANMVVRGITLLDHVPDERLALTADPLPAGGYRSGLLLDSPSSLSLIRGATSAIRLTVVNAGDSPWPTQCEIGQTPGAVGLGLLWFPAHSDDRTFSARTAEGRIALPYALSPGKSISLTAILAPFTPEGDFIPAGDYEVWVGPVQEGVAWFFEEGDDVLRLNVRVTR